MSTSATGPFSTEAFEALDRSNGDSLPNDDQMQLFVELYSQHYSRIQYYLMALLPSHHDVTDVLQETSLVLWKKFHTFEAGTNFMAWACQIARFQVLKQRQRNMRVPKLFESDVLDMLAQDVEATMERPEVQLEILEECIGQLPEKDRTLIRRRYEPNSSVKILAMDIGRNPNSVSKSLGRIRRALLTCIQRRLPVEWRK